MSANRTAIAIASLIGLAACGGGGPAAGDFAAACNARGDLDTELCTCLDEQAQGLSAETHAFVIATIAEDEAAAQAMRGDLDSDQALEAGQFISRGVQECLIDLPNTP